MKVRENNMESGPARRRPLVRQALISAVLLVVLAALAGGSAAQAQSTTHKLRIGDTVNGTLDAKTFAQVYAFDAVKGDSVTIVATAKTRGLALALMLSDSSGATIQQVAELTRADVTIPNFKPSVDGTYYVTVLRATGVQGNTSSGFSLALNGSSTASSGASYPKATLTSGMTVQLSWTSSDDINLEVRDPVGGSINVNQPASNGGKLTDSGNANCASTATTNPNQIVGYTTGDVPAGSYEILVHFNKGCPQGVTNVPFALTVTVDGKAQDPIRGNIAANQVYVANFVLSAPDTVQLNTGALNLGFNLTPFATKIASPTALAGKVRETGTINGANPADTYSLTGTKGELVSVSMGAINGGSLDSLLLLLDSNSNIITFNDDANSNTRDSLIANYVLPADGTYTIVASRYALALGGTEGAYALNVTTGRAVTTNPTTNATAAPTAPAVPTSDANAGQPRGSIEANVTWTSRADLRLVVRDPAGRLLFTDTPNIDSGGVLAQTSNLLCKQATGTKSQDYAYWNTPTPPAGTYEVRVFEDSTCNDTVDTSFTLTINVRATATSAAQQVINLSNAPGANKQAFLTTFTIDNTGKATAGDSGFVDGLFSVDVSKTLPNAGVVSYNQTVNGNITSDAKYTLYSFNGLAGDKIQITMVRKSGSLDSALFLLSSDSTNGLTQLQYNNGTSDPKLQPQDSRISATLTKDGTYIVVATHYGVQLGATTGSYTLQLSGPTR